MSILKTASFELAIYAKGDPDSPKLAIVIPGWLDTKDYVSHTTLVDRLSAKGYYALSFDPPGTWESPGSIELCTTTNYIKAVNELIEKFGNKPTLLVGHSRGGSVAMLVSPNPYVTAIAATMASFGAPSAPTPKAVQEGFEMHYRDMPPGSSRTAEQKEFALPLNYFIDGEQYDPIAVLRNFTKPKLIIYGDQDEFSSLVEVKEAFETLPDPKMIHEIKSAHGYRRYAEAVAEVNNIISDFVDKL